MSAPERVRRGEVASLAFRMSSPTPAAIHSVHLDVSDPDGKSAMQYSGNLLLRDGAAEQLLPFRLNDKPGNGPSRLTTGSAGERHRDRHRRVRPVPGPVSRHSL